MKKIAAFLLVVCLFQGICQDYEDEEYSYSCSLSVSTTVFPPDSNDQTGNGYVEALLCDKNGTPIANKEVKMTASCGILSCQSPGWYDDVSSISSDKSCFITGADGKVNVYLSRIPFNTRGLIRATCACDEIVLKSTSSYMISRKIIRKKRVSKRIKR
ncbi:MAG: hypothetical protein JW768_14800 [Chitinispirillaceae bacterium]|nr:hypothetical protein [Chitinispirillaceae bacterium]